MDNQEIRLQLYLARAGVGSRRACEKLITDGRVTVNGSIILEQGVKVSEEDRVCFDGRLVKPMVRKIYLALHKPSGFLCSNSDPDGRPLAKELFEDAVPQRVFNVGRLDYMTSGLIFYTNDGDFSRLMTHPSNPLEKEYLVTTKKEIPQALMEDFHKGLTVEGVHYRCKSYEILSSHRVRIILQEGKNRELRKVFQSRNITIKKVHRVRIGSVRLTSIAPGHFRMLKEQEVERLIELATGKKTAKQGGQRGSSNRRSGRRR